MNMKIAVRIHELEHRIATINRGDTVETDKLRIHRYDRSIKVWDLENAGKRGRQVRQFSVETDQYDLIDSIEKAKSFDEALNFAKDSGNQVYESTSRGIDVAPAGFKPISVKGKDCYVSADYDSFTVKDYSDINEETCIPAVRGGKADIKVFYRWVSDNESKIKNMDFDEIVNAMRSEGVRYHRYCALD